MCIQPTKEKERSLLADIKARSDDDYEKNITYITAGTLVLSLTFIEKIVSLNRSYAIWALITSWAVLVLTLLVNLISHQLSSLYHEKTIDEFDNEDVNLNKNITRRNAIIRGMNWGTTFSLTTGIIFLILFCSINSIKVANDKKKLHTPNDDSSYFEKGRSIIAPLSSGSSGSSSDTSNTAQSTSDDQRSNTSETESKSLDSSNK